MRNNKNKKNNNNVNNKIILIIVIPIILIIFMLTISQNKMVQIKIYFLIKRKIFVAVSLRQTTKRERLLSWIECNFRFKWV